MKFLSNTKFALALATFTLLLIAATIIASTHPSQRKVDLPKGNWSFSAHPYMGADLEDRPVIVTSVETVADRGLKLTRVTIRNRSTKPVTAVKLKWGLSYEQSQDIFLRNGATDWFDLPKAIPAGEKVTLRFIGQSPSFASMTSTLAKNGGLDGDFYFSIGVSEVRYEDGSSWIVKRLGNGYLLNASMKYSLPQVGCAKQKCKNIGGGYACESSTASEYCTNHQTSCTDTLCGEKPGGDEFEIEW